MKDKELIRRVSTIVDVWSEEEVTSDSAMKQIVELFIERNRGLSQKKLLTRIAHPGYTFTESDIQF